MSTDWKQRPEGGGRFAIWLIRTIARYGGRAVARLLLYPITAYFVLVRGPERRASQAFLQRALGRPAGWTDGFRHVHSFAATILDRVFMLSGQLERFDITIDGVDAVHAQLDRGQGVLMFGSHLGSFEVMRVLGCRRPGLKVRVVFDRGHNAAVTQLLEALDPQMAATVIDAAQDGPSIVFAIKQALDEGALVALLVDRARPGEPTVQAPFLGSPAPFPVAPWLIAAALKVPVMLAFGLYRGGRRYELAFELFSAGLDIGRHNRAQALPAVVHDYAARLQARTLAAPYNWFNFYDFWQTDDANDPACDPAGDAHGAGREPAGRRPA
ncbi:acyltransferase [Montanilutibacter psychrotolerans]|uniref:Acyltransferase n=1 Tax=Montanilutibacter psychrotolerans TaxID=1327343 RepID=A0A3M8SR93_9GAMM|nr:acyltransferase [Lysobacter psychrotolerans]RNF83837.1 acyltransferase [Lysobacter psychrotolerans]